MPETTGDPYISAECFRAYVDAEIKVPNTLIAVGPYVGLAAFAGLGSGDGVQAAVERFATTYSFSRSQINSAIRTVLLVHRRFGIAVLPDGVELRDGEDGMRLFPHARFEVVYMEGVFNILEAVLRLHGSRGEKGISRHLHVAELLRDPDRLAATVTAFSAATEAVNSPESTVNSEAFKEIFNFKRSGESPRAMAPAENDAIQAEVVPFISAAVDTALIECGQPISPERLHEFVLVLTSPELHAEAA